MRGRHRKNNKQNGLGNNRVGEWETEGGMDLWGNVAELVMNRYKRRSCSLKLHSWWTGTMGGGEILVVGIDGDLLVQVGGGEVQG
jgi:formylmethanofuran dehydrogenase subunit C